MAVFTFVQTRKQAFEIIHVKKITFILKDVGVSAACPHHCCYVRGCASF